MTISRETEGGKHTAGQMPAQWLGYVLGNKEIVAAATEEMIKERKKNA